MRIHAAALGVDVYDHVLAVRRLGPEERPGGGIERPDDAGLAGDTGHDLAPRARGDPTVHPFDRVAVRGHLGLDHEPGVRVVEVPFVVRDVLEVPDDRARVGVEGEGGVGVEDVAVAGAALHGAPGNRHSDPGVYQVQLGVVARRVPRGSAAAHRVGDAAPGVVAELAGAGNRVGAPHFLAGLDVVGRDPAARVEVIAARHPGHHPPLDDLRPARVVLARLPVTDRLVPRHLAGARVERQQVGVVRADDQLVLVERPVAGRAGQPCAVLDPGPAVLPQAGAIANVERLDVVARLHQEHDAVMDERRGLLDAFGHGPRPGEAQASHVGGVDLVEGAVTPVVVAAAPHEPVARRRVDEHVLGDRGVVVGGGLRGNDGSREQNARHERAGHGSREPSHWLGSPRQRPCRVSGTSTAPWAVLTEMVNRSPARL